MTIEEIELSLPNGFHDATMVKIEVDYVTGTAAFGMEVAFSDPEESGVESYRAATLHVSGLVYCVIEPPDPKYPFQPRRPLWVVGCPPNSKPSPAILLPETPDGAFAYSFFVNDWNSSIYLSALHAKITF